MIPLLLLNLILTLVWMILAESAGFGHLMLGFLVGAGVTSLIAMATGQPGYLMRLWRRVRFVLYFLRILIEANIEVLREIITPGFSMKPRMLRYEVAGLTPMQVTTLANAITLTPGTLSTDVSDDGEVLYIHAMYAENPDDAIAGLDELKDRLMQDVFSP